MNDRRAGVMAVILRANRENRLSDALCVLEVYLSRGGGLGGDGGVWDPTGSTIPHTSQPQF